MRGLLLLPLLLGACTWIGQDDYDARLPEMDDDGDGYAKAEDCDDGDPAIFPGATETWYDGIDSDCAGDDDYDADGDGWVPDEYVGLPTAGVEGSGELPGGDCNDADPDTWPGAPDTWYDGIDSDCGGEDDHDADGDGYVPVNHGGLETKGVPGSGKLPEGDCDDAAPDVHPGADDAWYDGVDTDCAGDDDYDADADGWVPADVEYGETRYAPGTGGFPLGDCDDADPDVHPEAADAWYDGVDSDCAGDDDYDADADGWVPDEYAGLPTQYVDGSGALPGGDCDDADPDIHPDTIEVLGDPIDQDCDGGADTFTLRTPDAYGGPRLGWVAARDLRAAAAGTSTWFGAAADAVEVSADTTSHTYQEAALLVEAAPSSTAELGLGTDVHVWMGMETTPTYTLTPGHDLLATSDGIFAAVAYQSSSGKRALVVGGYRLSDGATFKTTTSILASGGTAFQDLEDLGIAEDSAGDVHVVACESLDAVGQYMGGPPSALETGNTSAVVSGKVEGLAASLCALRELSDGSLEVLGAGASGLEAWTLDPTTDPIGLASSWSDAGIVPLDLDVAGDVAVVADAGSERVILVAADGSTTSVSVGPRPVQVAASLAPDGSVVVGVADEGGGGHVLLPTATGRYDVLDVAAPFSSVDEVAAAVDPTGTWLVVGALGDGELAVGAAKLP